MFLLDDGNIATIYTLPFLVGLAMPGRRSLIAMGCVAFAIAVLASAMNNGSFAAAFGLFFVLTAVGGLACGLITRGLTLQIAPQYRHPLLFIVIALLGYALPPVVYSGPAATMAWLKRPSQQVCLNATYRMTTAGMTLNVRATPLFSVHEVKKAGSNLPHFMSFDSDTGLKDICGRGLRDHRVIGPVAVNLNPSRFGSSNVQNWAKASCESPSVPTLILVCGLMDNTNPIRRLESATIYGPELDAAIAAGGAYAVEKRLQQHIAETKELYALVCEGDETATFERALFCAAQETLANGLRVKFLLRTNGEKRSADSEAIRAYLHELIASFSPAAPA